ncbi:hypothetical protein GN244_ATG16672 [Phytophthora infestans]|uniref:Uncharacterized protein n=1 Tax=Phytophthora infestans TaxID=4787 RepID=A0A833SAB3_PHYIN|nr:hypothetical protein GN244_ATG16672 [Phytophthora infestans]KAF4130405.1 hypothetical protein GN958_ATG20403 [Phytophthora infestans]
MAKRKSFATGGEAKKRRHVRRATERESSDPITLSTSAKFKYAWKKLRKAGWTLKSPSSRSLDSRYRYSRPESDPRGTEGEDFLLGEASVVKYVSEQNQLQLPVNDAMLIQVSIISGGERHHTSQSDPHGGDADWGRGQGDGGARDGVGRGRGPDDSTRPANSGRGGSDAEMEVNAAPAKQDECCANCS